MSNSIDPHLAARQGRWQRVADTDQTMLHCRLSPQKLCKSWKRNWIFPGLRSKPSALKCINVKKINYINVVQRSLQTRKEARALGLKFALGQFGARAQQAVGPPRNIVGEGTMGLNKPNTHCNFLT